MGQVIAKIRTSDRIAFKRCRRKWGFSSSLKMNRTNEESKAPLWMGTGFHYAMEDYHGYNNHGHPSEAFRAYVRAVQATPLKRQPDNWEDLQDLAISMTDYYVEWLKSRQSLQTFWYNGKPQVEVQFEIPLPISQELKEKNGWDDVVYQGTLDRVCIDEHGRLWILDYKTAKSFATHHLDTDPQITTYCVPLNSEIMTKRGWKKYNELFIGEQVLGYNKGTGVLEWAVLENIHTPGVQETVIYSNKSFSFVSTPDHNWVQQGNGIHSIPMKDGKDGWKTIMAASLDSTALDITPNEAALLAWILADGSFGWEVNICQSKKKYHKEVQELLNTFENSYTRISERDNCYVWHISEPFFRLLLTKAGLDRQLNGWEQFITGMSLEAREAFCAAAMLADGSKNVFFQNKGIKQEIFKLAFFLCGKFPTKPKECSIGGFKNKGICQTFTLGTPHKVNRTIKKETLGPQEVWCPQTSLGTWVMRQGEQITITGNCWAGTVLYPGQSISGFVYQQHKKDYPGEPEFLKSSKSFSTSKSQSTTHRMYKNALVNLYGDIKAAPEKNVSFLNWLAQQEDSNMDAMIRRDWEFRNDHQIEAEGAKILMEAEDMINRDLPLYPNPTRDCAWDCDFKMACVMMDDGSDWEYEIKTGTISRSDEDDNWRKFI